MKVTGILFVCSIDSKICAICFRKAASSSFISNPTKDSCATKCSEISDTLVFSDLSLSVKASIDSSRTGTSVSFAYRMFKVTPMKCR